MGAWWLFLIPVVLFPFGLIVMGANDVDEVAQAQQFVVENANKKIQEFGNGESIEFELDPLPPSQEFVWVNKQYEVERIIVTDEGIEQKIVVNETVTEQVPTKESEIYGELKDRQSGDTKVCKRGNQCDIFGRINLYEPTTGLRLEPIMFHYEILCRTSTDPVLICDNYFGQSDTILSYPDSTFAITLTTDNNDPTGEYEMFIRATSKYKDPYGQPVEREGSVDIKVIE